MFQVQIRSDGINLGFFTKKLTIANLNQPVKV